MTAKIYESMTCIERVLIRDPVTSVLHKHTVRVWAKSEFRMFKPDVGVLAIFSTPHEWESNDAIADALEALPQVSAFEILD